MNTGELLTRGTAGVALLLYVTALVLRTMAVVLPSLQRVGRIWWSAGAAVFLLHVVCAFQFVHHWSHAAAYEATARQTLEVTGLNSGAGLFMNYVFTLLWVGDACWWWLAEERYRLRARVVEWSVQGFLGFMWFNATVVFGHGAARWLGVGATVLLGRLWLPRLVNHFRARHPRG